MERMPLKNLQKLVLNALTPLVFTFLSPAQSLDSIVFTIVPAASRITFFVKSSVKLEGTLDKWDDTLIFTSTDASTGALDIKIQADSVNTGSKSKDDKLKGEKCFDVAKNPYITFQSTKITQTSPDTFDVAGVFMLRGISKPQSLTFTVDREAGGDTGKITGILTINRKDYGLGGGIKFITIADRVDVTINFKAKRAGPPLVFK